MLLIRLVVLILITLIRHHIAVGLIFFLTFISILLRVLTVTLVKW